MWGDLLRAAHARGVLLWASYGPHQVEVGKGEVSRVGSTCLLRSKHTSREEAAPACDGMSLRVPSNFNTPRAYRRLDPTPSYPRSDTQGSLMGALNTPRERRNSSAEPICFDNLKAASLRRQLRPTSAVLPLRPMRPRRRTYSKPSAAAFTATATRCWFGPSPNGACHSHTSCATRL